MLPGVSEAARGLVEYAVVGGPEGARGNRQRGRLQLFRRQIDGVEVAAQHLEHGGVPVSIAVVFFFVEIDANTPPLSRCVLKVEVYDWDQVGEHDLLGEVRARVVCCSVSP